MQNEEYIEALESWIRRGTNDVNVYFTLAQLYLQTDQLEKAKKTIKDAQSRALNSPELYDIWAVALLRSKLALLAEVEIKKGIKLFPRDAALFKRLGGIVGMSKRYQSALEAFQEAYRLKPSEEYQKLIASASSGVKKAKTSEDLLLAANSISDQLPQTWLNLGRCYVSLGKYTNAIEAFDKLLALVGEGDFYAYTNFDKGQVLAILGRYSEARQCIEINRKAFPRNAEAFRYEGQLLEILGNPKEAEVSYRRAAQIESMS